MNINNILTLDSELYKNCNSYEQKFCELSNYLLNRIILVANKKNHRICEIEFYLKEPSHKDKFVHGDPDQKIKCRWYFHRHFGKNYRGGTYKGLDLTFGYDNKKNVYGGILIRSILEIESNDLIEGSCKVVNHILKITEFESINDLVSAGLKDGNKTLIADESNNALYCKIDDKNILKNEHVYSGPRVGLTLKKPNKLKHKYIMKNYRYLIYSDRIKKFGSGIVLKLYSDGKTENEIENITKIKKNNILKYIKAYESGKSKKMEDFHDKNLKVNDLNMLQGLFNKISH